MADADPRWASSVRSSSAAVSTTGARFRHMTVSKLVETTPGKFSLLLNAGTTPVDALVEELGHEPNGYFWEGVARRLVATEAPSLESRFRYDPEADMFCAYGEDRAALEALGELIDAVAMDGTRMQSLVAAADADGFDFDD
jgi:hypothetical protein